MGGRVLDVASGAWRWCAWVLGMYLTVRGMYSAVMRIQTGDDESFLFLVSTAQTVAAWTLLVAWVVLLGALGLAAAVGAYLAYRAGALDLLLGEDNTVSALIDDIGSEVCERLHLD